MSTQPTIVDPGNGSSAKATPKDRGVLIGETIDVVLAGVTPLLMHRMTTAELQGLYRRKGVPIDTEEPFEDVAARRIYHEVPEDPSTPIGIPTKCLYAGLKLAGKKVPLHGRVNVSNSKGETLLFSLVNIDRAFLPLQGSLAWTVELERVQLDNRGSKTAQCAVRPRFDDWGLKFRFYANYEGIKGASPHVVRTLFDKAGRDMGLCAWRPQKGGSYGKFRVHSWDIVDQDFREAEIGS